MQTSQTIGALVAAIAKAQLEIRNPTLDKVHPHFKGFRYASLGSHIDAIREAFAKHGLIVSQGIDSDDMRVSVTTMISHTSGEWMSSAVGMTLAEKATAQNLGACVTYLRRYALASMCLLTGDDDTDAEEDRQSKEPPRATPVRRETRDVFDPTPVNAPAGTYEKPKPASQPKHKWPKEGLDIVRPVKVVERENNQFAVLCAHATAGQAWVCIDASRMKPVSEGDNVEIGWSTNAAGVIVANSVREPEAFRDEFGNLELPIGRVL
jgi:hypothetical protein